MHVNTLAIEVGICLFYIYLLAVKRERRYYTVLFAIMVLAVAVVLMVAFLPGYNEMFFGMKWLSGGKRYVSLREEVNERYWIWTKEFVHNVKLFKIALTCVVIVFVKGLWEKSKDRICPMIFQHI